MVGGEVDIRRWQGVGERGGGGREGGGQLRAGEPFEEFFDDFFKNRRGGAPKGGERSEMQPPRKTNWLGSGFIIDASGVVVTNNHVIADADEINAILNDVTKLTAELGGAHNKPGSAA